MKTIPLLICMLLSGFAAAQNYATEKKEIETVIRQFKESIIRKDSAAFYRLFHENPVVWIGVVKNRSQAKRLQSHPGNTKNYFKDTYDNFFRYIMEPGRKEEEFKNIRIVNDDVTASVTFDYVFREDNTITNWGDEAWHLIKAEGKWKIVSVIYSYENAKFFPKPE
ncbi:nuclear transport factor 2 family protein [uncultured Chryseobacterium sp.]|uniref:nuclear transport factor 2 family protein n=1 Tax=uncultured Chryseobacterium sp. TaxID=259322 RepID=UPI0025F3A43D|nr:nuclear transport factor 2 family protein [uncultured Chryseobacterium sp.]